jgi:hypothetical protein
MDRTFIAALFTTLLACGCMSSPHNEQYVPLGTPVEFKGLLATGGTTVIIDQVDPNDGTKIRELGRFTSDPNPAGKDAAGVDLFPWQGNITFDESYFNSHLSLVLKPHAAGNPLATFDNTYWTSKCIKDNLGQGLGAVVNQCKSSASPAVVIRAIKPNPAYCDPDYSYIPVSLTDFNAHRQALSARPGGGGFDVIGDRNVIEAYACRFNYQFPPDPACPEGAFIRRYTDFNYTCTSDRSSAVSCHDGFKMTWGTWTNITSGEGYSTTGIPAYVFSCISRDDEGSDGVNEGMCTKPGAIMVDRYCVVLEDPPPTEPSAPVPN